MWLHQSCVTSLLSAFHVNRLRSAASACAQMGVDTSRTEHIKIAVDITFPALPCHGEPRPANSELPPPPFLQRRRMLAACC